MIRTPTFTLKYGQKDITNDIKPFILSIDFTDKLEGESDDLTVSLENSDLRWLDTWLPKEGDTLTLTIGYEDEQSFAPVTFEIDEPEFSGMPDKLQLKAMATPITASLRQKNTKAYENMTLRTIAQQIAQKHGLELVGNVPDIKVERVTQKEQSDLEFLLEQSQEYGLVFKIEGAKRLVFYKLEDLEKAEAILTIARTDIKSYRLRRKAAGTYKACKIKYYDPKTGKYIEATIDIKGNELPKPKEGEQEAATGDVLNIRTRVENLQQAKAKAKEELRRANSSRFEMDLDLEGSPILAAGVNVTVSGFFKFDGKYMLEQVNHNLSKSSGYTNRISGRKVDE